MRPPFEAASCFLIGFQLDALHPHTALPASQSRGTLVGWQCAQQLLVALCQLRHSPCAFQDGNNPKTETISTQSRRSSARGPALNLRVIGQLEFQV